MSKREVGPFRELGAAMDGELFDEPREDWLEVMDWVRDLFVAAGCRCNGEHLDAARDPDWGGDLSELVCRAARHEIFGTDGVELVAVKLETLVAEVDSHGEITTWIYEES